MLAVNNQKDLRKMYILYTCVNLSFFLKTEASLVLINLRCFHTFIYASTLSCKGYIYFRVFFRDLLKTEMFFSETFRDISITNEN